MGKWGSSGCARVSFIEFHEFDDEGPRGFLRLSRGSRGLFKGVMRLLCIFGGASMRGFPGYRVWSFGGFRVGFERFVDVCCGGLL